MTITTLDQYIAAAKQRINFVKNGARTTAAGLWYNTWDLAGNPGAGTIAGVGANGAIQTDATTGAPLINAFGASNTGYLGRVEFGSSVACRIMLFDLLWKGGPYAFNSAAAAITSPSWSGRVPGGTDFTGVELWAEQVTASTGIQSVSVSYTNQSGVAGRTAPATSSVVAGVVGRLWQIALQAGDSGLQSVQSVTGTVATVGTFNLLALRQLWSSRVRSVNDGDVHDFIRTGLNQIFEDSALMVAVAPDGTAIGIPEMQISIVNG